MSGSRDNDYDLNNEGIRQCFSKIVPETASTFSEVIELHFHPRKVTRMPPGIEKATELEVLNLSNNFCQTLRDIFGFFPKLRHLSLNDNKLIVLPDSLSLCTSLEYLDISGNYIDELPDIFNFPELKYLNISINRITKLPPSLYRLTKLETFYAFFNDIDELDSTIGNLISIKDICLNWNKIKLIPSNLFQIHSLQLLYLTHNKKLSQLSFPDSLKISSIEHLDISRSNIFKFPDRIFEISSLMELTCGYNNISMLPDEFYKLPNLIELTVPGNRLTSLPNSIGECQELIFLNASMNRLESIPSHLYKAHKLRELKLNDNSITELPSNMDAFLSLEKLDISDNKLQALNPSIAEIPNLTQLDVSWNIIARLPDSFTNARRLKHLNLSNNALEELPENLGDLSDLEVLDLASNKLKKLTPTILKLHKLKSINYEENRELQVDDEFLDYIEQKFYQDIETGEVHASIYDDPQNTHRSSIRQSIQHCIEVLKKDYCEYTIERVYQDFRTESQREALMKHIVLQDRLKIYGLSLQEVAVRVWSRIKKYPVRQSRLEMIRLFHDAVQDDAIYCYSRRMADFIGILQGYYDDIVIKISESERIQGIISYIINNVDKSEWISRFNERMDDIEVSHGTREVWEKHLREHLFD